MSRRTRKGWSWRLAVGVSLLAAAGGCAPTGAGEPVPGYPTVAFVNSTVSSASVYLESAGRAWLLGRVDPGETAMLRVPAGMSLSGLFSLIAVPIGSRDTFGRSASLNPSAIRSMPGSADDLLALRWTLLEQQLITVPLPGGGVAANRVR